MKLVVWIAGLAAFVGSGTYAAESAKSPVRIDLDDSTAPRNVPAKPATPASKAAPAKPPATKASPPAKQKEPAREVDGFAIVRRNGGFLGVKVEGNTFRVTFYDKDKKPVVADVAAIALRWPVQYQPNPERTLLKPNGDGKTLTSDKVVRPPFQFKLYLTLLKTTEPGGDAGDETYTVDFAP
jgi:hypothetical protein